MSRSTFEGLIQDLTSDVARARPKDSLQFCSNWFQSRLEEQRARRRTSLAEQPRALSIHQLPEDHFVDTQASHASIPPFLYRKQSMVPTSYAPYGTLSAEAPAPSPFNFGSSPSIQAYPSPDDALHPPPNSAIFLRRSSVSAESIYLDGEDGPLPVYPKSADQLRRIKDAIAGNFIFRDLEPEQATGVLNAMQERRAGRDEVVIRQGEQGDNFYVVEAGELTVYVHDDPTLGFGDEVASYSTGHSFGELALLYGHPRAATVISTSPDTILWSIDRTTFRTIILKAAHRRRTFYEQFLSSVPLLSSLEADEKSKVADALHSQVFEDGDAVVTEGELGETFFFIEEGEAIATQTETGEDTVWRATKGDYFGELSLLRRAPRAATVSAVHRTDSSIPKLKVAILNADAFTRLLGPLRDILEREAVDRYAPRGSISL